MSHDKSTRERYRHLRDEFDGLKIEDKALFLVEAAASTVARGADGVRRAGSARPVAAHHAASAPASQSYRRYTPAPSGCDVDSGHPLHYFPLRICKNIAHSIADTH